ncbi:hypothetical protein D3C73_737210 [compost metagenome]
MTQICQTKHVLYTEPLISPFGFKGSSLSELWQSVSGLRGETGALGIGIGVQSVLWSDPRVFIRHGEDEGNRMMGEITRYALRLAQHIAFATPIDLINHLLPEVYAYGQSITGSPDLRYTFVLNALVSVDQASWGLCSQERSALFEDLVPELYRSTLTHRHTELASIPMIPYGMTGSGIQDILNEGYFLLKIKLGADPDQDGDQEKMLEWDKLRLSQIHTIAQLYTTSHTHNGKIAYYLDANGRYDSKDRLSRLLDHADHIGALESIILFEEPFSEEMEADVSDLPVRFAADESVHNEMDALKRIEMGYGAFALKPVAKTMSMSLQIAKLAVERGIPCFCADLTANPILADWNKNLAARLPPLPGLKVGILETNGHQNYRNWQQMKSCHPRAGAPWIESVNGMYPLGELFYETGGGALEVSPYYESLLDLR